ADGPTLCEVAISPDEGIAPRAAAFRRPDGVMESRPLEDMAPFLPPEEVWENLHQFDEDRHAGAGGGDERGIAP
ncbi:MAG TPA: hypothetical protein VK576_10515, partial [Thermoleophilia bacterium]|nr:hypothetical protein [Thermoleophilia bacterium]